MTTVSGPAPVEFDGFHPMYRENPYPSYRRARAAGAFCPFQLGPVPVHIATRYEAASAILQSPDWGHGYRDGISPFRPNVKAEDVAGSFLAMDPPDHTRLRALVGKAFTPRMVARLAQSIDALVRKLVDAGAEQGELDVVGGLARPVSMAVMCELIGIPQQDSATFGDWGRAIARGTDPDFTLTAEDIENRHAASEAFAAYFRDLIAFRRARPAEDLVSGLAAVEERGDVLTERELLGVLSLLWVAGVETTVNLIGNGVLALLRHPEQQRLLRDRPELAASAVDEMLRYDPPVHFTIRVALADITVSGHRFRRGDGVVVLMASAGRDESVFPDADTFDITRYAGATPARRHLGFGLGPHYCLGAPLARMEAEAEITELLRRTPELRLANDNLSCLTSLAHRGVSALPLALDGRRAWPCGRNSDFWSS
ncbi:MULTISPECIES: cytochrome P450 [Protofrankia]|uniref:Linalool 8-monooxygenase n=1 Tax=Candidatus Protofrankia datiscae TaxID=2716812 RepID=F8B635_9ACTN|nr:MULTISPECIES: cytochrome P450 [Protofrankia]AEH10200.1 Linalool 8-monooxygenase [Candidatus Protofrankia datiscae]